MKEISAVFTLENLETSLWLASLLLVSARVISQTVLKINVDQK